MKNKRPEKLTNGVTILFDTAPLHVAQTVQDLLGRMSWGILQ